MTATNIDDQLCEIYPTMLDELNCTFGVSFSHFHCCGCHGHSCGCWPIVDCGCHGSGHRGIGPHFVDDVICIYLTSGMYYLNILH